MDLKKSLKDVIVLVAICAVFAVILAATNSVTAPIIKDRLEQAANEAYFGVMEGATGFDTVTTDKVIPSTVKEIKKEQSGMGYAIKIETKGYGSGLTLIIGVSADGIVTGAQCIASNETNKHENSYGNNFIGKDLAGVGAVDLVAGSTLTTEAYRNAVIDAINTVSILGGKEVDLRTEEEKFQDALEAALPDGEGKFTKVVLLSDLDGIDSVYKADNDKGYVCVIGTDSTGTFIGINAEGKAIGSHSDEIKSLAEKAIEQVKSETTVDVDLSQFDNSLIKERVNYAKKAGNGTYIIEIKTKGQFSSETPIVIMVVIDANGKLLNAQTVSHDETPTYGGLQLADGKFNTTLIGKNETEIGGVDTVAGTTVTTTAFKNAILDAFNVVKILGGEEVDTRTEEEKFQDALEAALPAGEGSFTKMVLLSAVEGIDSVYEADNGAGYVCVIGTDSTGTFIGVDAEGVAVGEVSAEHKALAEAAIASIKANTTEDIDLSQFDNSLIKESVNSVKKTGTGTYVIEIKTKGQYTASTPIVLTIVIDADGKIVDVQTVSHGETPTFGGVQLEDGKFNVSFIGKNETEAGGVDIVAGTTFTTTAFKNAILDAFNVIKIVEGEEVDTRTEEEKFQDALEAALPDANGEFTKYFKVEVIEGFDAIYVADNNAGYVFVIGTDSTGTFIGVNSAGEVIGDHSGENKSLAENAFAIISATGITDIDVSMYNVSGVPTDIRRIFRVINYVQKTSSGNYIIEIQCDGHGKKGDPSHEHASGERYVIKVCISADGVILDSQTISHSETPTWGGPQLEDGAYNSNFIGKNETEAGGVDTVAGTTNTTGGYKEAILRCFAAIEIIEGGIN